MKIARVVLVCPCCGHRITDPTVILAARAYSKMAAAVGGGVNRPMRFGCIKCHSVDPGTDVELEERIEDLDVPREVVPAGDVDPDDPTTEARLRRLEAGLEALRSLVRATIAATTADVEEGA